LPGVSVTRDCEPVEVLRRTEEGPRSRVDGAIMNRRPVFRIQASRPVASLAGLCRARDLIRAYHDGPVTLADCAAEAGLSPWHLLRSFRATFGETPKEFLTRLRLERAEHLLTVTDRSVTEVCLDVGFSSLGTFSALFKRHVGCPPSDYRRRVRRWVTMPGYPPWALIPACFVARFGGRSGSNFREELARPPLLSCPPCRR
jgi:AraC-like DNA-binding protein